MSENTFDLTEFCARQTEVCEQARADAARRAVAQHSPSYSEQERVEHLYRTVRDLAHADVRLERATAEKRRADHELDLAKRSRLLAHDAYHRAVTVCASAPETSTPEEYTRP